ncbi:MAG: bifunctional glutamate N-acetyltransferase/amino-acid acetyltransferase ArgJ [Myxococcota bacterium]
MSKQSLPELPPVSVTLGDLDSLPQGFHFGATRCGIKQGRPDLGLIRSTPPAAAAGVFTRNPARAACVDRDAGLVPNPGVAAIVVNSGNANAMTGPSGEQTNEQVARDSAIALRVDLSQVLTMSTGVIGQPLPADKITDALPGLCEGAQDDPMVFAQAILTTDTGTKVAQLNVPIPGASEPIRLLGIAKGSGMIHPNMATTLGFVCTDAAIGPARLQAMLSEHIDDTFNGICVDGDTSTNDSVVVLANGTSKTSIHTEEAEQIFSAALRAVLASLARQVALDGEGATRMLEVEVKGAPDLATARFIGRAVCRSSLVKCSTFAGQADWGRIAAATGQAVLEHDLSVDPRQMTILAQGIALYTREGPCEGVDMDEVSRRMRDGTVRWTLELGDGPGEHLALGCDLSYDYVRINADEATKIETTAEGVVRRNLGLGGYSPRLKHQLIVDGLAYVRRFVGLHLMVHIPQAPVREDLIAKLAQDLELCLDANIRPLLVVSNPEIAEQVRSHLEATGHYCASVTTGYEDARHLLDRGHLCTVVLDEPNPTQLVRMAINLGMQKLIVMGPERGLRDEHGFVQTISHRQFLVGLEQERFATVNPELLALAEHAARQGVPAVHLIDQRLPHALVGELFTDEGIGSLITRQAVQ